MKLKQKIKQIKDYLTRLNNNLRTFPIWRRILIGIGIFFASILFATIPFIPLGLFCFILSLKILWDVYKDWRKKKNEN